MQKLIPVVITGERLEDVELAGEIADGLLTWGGRVETVRNLRKLAEPFVKKRGWTPDQWGVLPWVPFSVGEDEQAAKEPLRPRMTEVIRRVPPPILQMMGVDDAQVAPIRDAWSRGDREGAQKLLTDDILDQMTIFGTPKRCIERIRELAAEGVSEVMLQFTYRWREDFEALHKYILPEL